MNEDVDQTFSRDGKVLHSVKRLVSKEELERREALNILSTLRKKPLVEWSQADLIKGLWSLLVVLNLA